MNDSDHGRRPRLRGRQVEGRCALGEQLLGIVNERPVSVFSGDAAALGTAVRFHRIAPLAYRALRGGNPDLAEQFRVDRDRAMFHHLRASAVLAEIGEFLHGIPWLAFKGPVLSEFAHPIPGIRTYKDLDILVAPGDLREAARRLFSRGWNVIDSDEDLRNPEIAGELRIASRAGILVDLHWAMVVSKPLRQIFPLAAEALLARRVSARIGPASAWMLDPYDAAVHVFHHAALAGAVRLLHLLDADQLARQVSDWDLLVDRAREWDATVQTGLVLSRAQRWLHTPIPNDLGTRLGLTPALEMLMSGVDRLAPAPRLLRDASLARLFAKAARPTATRTAALAARNLASGVVNRLRPPVHKGPRLPASANAIEDYFNTVEALT